jgi:hypothetical protein
VVRSWLARAPDKASDAKQGLTRWWALSREQLRNSWAHQRGRPATMQRSASDAFSMSDSASVSKQFYPPVGPKAGSDREWLLHLDQRLHSLYDLVDQADQNRTIELSRQLAAQRDKLRAEIQRETRQGWQLIVTGLLWSGVGTGLGIFA